MWLTGGSWNPEPAGNRFGELLEKEGILRIPGAHNALAGLLARDAGFEALYVSGGALSAAMGWPISVL